MHLLTVTQYQSRETSFPKSTCEGRRGQNGVLQRRAMVVLGGYLVPSETRAGRISYRGLFVEETGGDSETVVL